MSDSLHNLAKAAKNRIRNSLIKESLCVKDDFFENDIEIVKENNAVDKEDDFYLKVCEILKKNLDLANPIGELIERPYYDKLAPFERERYILKLSAKYLDCKNKFLKENSLL